MPRNGRRSSIGRTGAVARAPRSAASLLPYCLNTMTLLEIALGYLITFGLPLWLVIEQIVDERRRLLIAIAIRDERRRVAASHEAVARKAVSRRAA